jgi:hypothetical protein
VPEEALAAAAAGTGNSMLGRRVRIYWPGEDMW